MLESQLQSAPTSRAEGKRRSRQKLITATINSIAKSGFAETTLARVSAGAGLSRGIVNFHFRTKEALFLEALKFLSREYQENWSRAFDRAGPSAAEKLEAVLMVDFVPPLSNRNRIAAWYAYYGEAKSRPTYIVSVRGQGPGHLPDRRRALSNDHRRGWLPESRPGTDRRGTQRDGGGTLAGYPDQPERQQPGVGETDLEHLSEGAVPQALSDSRTRSQLRALFPKHFPIARRTGD